MRKWREMVAKKKIFSKNAKFSRNDFSFSLETLVLIMQLLNLRGLNLLKDESGRVLGGKHASIQFAYDLNKVIVLILYKL